MSEPSAAELAPMLQRIIDLLETLPARMQAPQSGAALGAADRAYLLRLAPVVDRDIGACVWSVADLLNHAASSPDLAAAIDGRTGRTLGKLFARAEGGPLNGWRIVRGVEVREGWLWMVERV